MTLNDKQRKIERSSVARTLRANEARSGRARRPIYTKDEERSSNLDARDSADDDFCIEDGDGGSFTVKGRQVSDDADDPSELPDAPPPGWDD